MPYNLRRLSLRKIAKLLDLAVIGAAFLTALVISSGSFTWLSLAQLLAVRIKVINLVLLLGYMLFCSLVFSLSGFYWSRRVLSWSQRVGRIFMAVTIVTGALVFLRDPFDLSFATNSFLFDFWLIACSGLILAHETTRALQYTGRLHGRNFRNVVIIGDEHRALTLAARIQQHPTLGYRLLRIISTKETEV